MIDSGTRGDAAFRRRRAQVLAAVVLTTALVAIEATILATTVSGVVADIGGLDQSAWLFSAYVLAHAVSVIISGRCADMFGRRPVMLIGVAVFVLGSLLCGLAWGMIPLIAFRALQGIGGGALQSTGMTLVGDLYTIAERGRIMGVLGGIWGLGSIIGPLLGALLAETAGWRWIFLINVPLGLAAIVVFWRVYRESVLPENRWIDVAGLVLFGIACISLLVMLNEGAAWGWTSPTTIVLAIIVVVSSSAFVLVERRVAEPIIPGWVLRQRILLAANIASFLLGAILLGLTVYVPLFAQLALGMDTLASAVALMGLSIGWPLSASFASAWSLRFGFRATALVGAVIVTISAALLFLIGTSTGLIVLAANGMLLGVGMGLVATPALVGAQSSVTWSSRGTVTGVHTFARSLGQAIGISVFAAVAVSTSNAGGGISGTGILGTFAVAAGIGVLLVIAAAFLPRAVSIPEETSARSVFGEPIDLPGGAISPGSHSG